MNKNFKILGAVMLGFMSFSCNNNQGSHYPSMGRGRTTQKH